MKTKELVNEGVDYNKVIQLDKEYKRWGKILELLEEVEELLPTSGAPEEEDSLIHLIDLVYKQMRRVMNEAQVEIVTQKCNAREREFELMMDRL